MNSNRVLLSAKTTGQDHEIAISDTYIKRKHLFINQMIVQLVHSFHPSPSILLKEAHVLPIYAHSHIYLLSNSRKLTLHHFTGFLPRVSLTTALVLLGIVGSQPHVSSAFLLCLS